MSKELLDRGVDPDDALEDDQYCDECGHHWDNHTWGEPILDKDGVIIGRDYTCPSPSIIDDDLEYMVAVDHLYT